MRLLYAGFLICGLSAFSWASGIYTPGGTLLPGNTNYIQNNPPSVQTATMTISGTAQFDKAIFDVYNSSPTSAQTGLALLAQVNSAAPCIWTYDSVGNRYHLCFTLDNPAAGGNSGQCMGLMCGLTYP